MRALIKLSLFLTLAIAAQRGLQLAAINAAEARFECEVMWARLRGVPMDAPQLLDLAEPLIGCVTCAHPPDMLFGQEDSAFSD